MTLTARAIPIASKQQLDQLIEGIRHYPDKTVRDEFINSFGGAVEHWFYQEVEGRPFLIAVIEGEDFGAGFEQYAASNQPFFLWFRQQVLDLTGVDMREVPGAATSEYVFKFCKEC
ncbi:MAG: hypothetical protein AAGH65_08445 [Pseudomonadota bacterium]